MRLQGDEYSKRLESYTHETIVLLSKVMGLPREFYAKGRDITTDSELSEEEVAKKLTDLIGTAIIETFGKNESTDKASLKEPEMFIGDPEECECCNCRECEHLLECVDQLEWPEYSKNGEKIKFLFKVYVGPNAGKSDDEPSDDRAFSPRFENYSDETKNLITATLYLPEALYLGSRDVVSNTNIDEEELAKRLKDVLTISILFTFEKSVETNKHSLEESKLVPGDPEECECCNCRQCEHLIDCVKETDWPADLNDGNKIRFFFDD